MSPRLNSIVARALIAVVAAVVFAMAGNGQAQVINAAWHKGMHGALKIAVATEVGGTLLEPGSYEVKVKNSGGTSVVEFARWTYNPYAQEGLPVWDREVVATVNALPQETNSVAAQTGLLLASSGSHKAVALQIRGASVEYGF